MIDFLQFKSIVSQVKYFWKSTNLSNILCSKSHVAVPCRPSCSLSYVSVHCLQSSVPCLTSLFLASLLCTLSDMICPLSILLSPTPNPYKLFQCPLFCSCPLFLCFAPSVPPSLVLCPLSFVISRMFWIFLSKICTCIHWALDCWLWADMSGLWLSFESGLMYVRRKELRFVGN